MNVCVLQSTLEAISEACIAGLDHKTPSVKAETAAFLARCFAKCTPVTLPKKLLKLFVTALLKVIHSISFTICTLTRVVGLNLAANEAATL